MNINLQKSLQTFAAIAGAISIIIVAYEWVASKQYVQQATDPISKDVKQILAIGIADQISTLHRYNCNNPDDDQFVSLMREKKLKFAELTGREYMEVPCDKLSN